MYSLLRKVCFENCSCSHGTCRRSCHSLPASDVSSTLTRLEREGKRASKSTKATHRRKALLSIREKLQHALESDLDEESLREYLAAIQAEAVQDLSTAADP